MEDFNRELTPGNTKAAMKAVGTASSDLWKVAPGQLRTLEDLTVDLVVGNEGEPLSTYEQAVVCKRLAPPTKLSTLSALTSGAA